MDFVSSSNNNTSCTNGAVNTAHEVSTASTQVNDAYFTNIDNLSDAVICAFFASQPNSPQLVHEDLQQIHPDDIEEMDLRWQMSMLTMRARRFLKNTGRKLTVNGNETIGFDKSKLTPSYIGNFHLQTPDLSFIGLDEFVNKLVVENCKAMSSEEEPKIQVSDGLGPQKKLIFLPNVQGNPQMDLHDQGVIDSGCSRHMTRNMSYLTDYKEIDGGYVAFGGNPKGGKITGKGTIKTSNLDFENVYFVRELKFNLFSVSQMCDKKNSVLFNDTECIVLSPNFKLIDESQVLLRVPRKNNMYSVDLKNIVPKGGLTYLFAKATSDKSKLWHRRLGHLNFKTMNKLVKGNLVRGLPSKLFENDQTCVACQKGKQHRASSTKDETSGILKSFITGIENLVDHKVKVIRCDNGTEFKNREMNQFCKMKEAVNTASYVQNRVLVVKPHNKTPYELFHGRTPTLSFMRPFGCPVTILNTIDHLGKFDGKADEGFFVGYSLNSKAFRVFISRTRIVEENLHITFSESTPNVAGIQSNGFADPKSSYDDGSKPSSDDGKKVDKDPRKESECNDQEKEDNVNSNNNVNSTGTNEVNVVGVKIGIELPFNPNMTALEDYIIFDFSRDDEDDGVVADMNNSNTTIQVSPIPTTRIHKDHHLDQVIRDLQSATQTRKMSKNLEEHGFEEPKKVIHTLNDPSWIDAMQEEILQFELQEVWTLVDLPNGKRDYTQEEGTDYDEVFAPVARIESIRLFLAYASFKDFMVYKMDVKSDFLYKKIEKEVYVCQLPGFEDPDFPDKVYKVKKVLYGLHQAPRAWYETLSIYLLDNGFQRGKNDKTLFIKRYKGDILLVQVYIDDIIFGSTKKELCIAFEKLMHEKFQMSSMRELTFFLGLQVQQKKDGIFISQDKYVVGQFKEFWVTVVKTTRTPMETQFLLILRMEQCDYAGSSLDRKSTTRDETVHKELGDSLVRAATTTSSLEVEQDSGNITKTRSKATPNESSSLGTTSGGGPRCQETMGDTIAQTRFENVSKHSNDSLLARGNTLRSDEDRLKLDELMALCTTLQNRVLDLEKTKTSQHNEIASLKRRVKKLEKKNRSRTHKLKRLYKVGLRARVESSDDEESLVGEEVVKVINTAKLIIDVAQVSAAGDKVSAASAATTVSAATTTTTTTIDDITLA
ncbi:retrovirus-related pol polyprotein from transposon TNT 1-94 [Tanacetum coccineum]